MTKIFRFLLLTVVAFSVFGCDKNSTSTEQPAQDAQTDHGSDTAQASKDATPTQPSEDVTGTSGAGAGN